MKKSLLLLALFFLLAGCAPQTSSDPVDPLTVETIKAVIEVENYGSITLELYPQVAPETVSNFCALARQGFYDGLTFHRIVEGFILQGGDPNGDGTGGPGYCIPGEFAENGVENSISHERGVISMARTMDGYDTAGSQFFIVHQDSTELDGSYAAFGRVTAGMDVVDSIAKALTNKYTEKPYKNIIISSITIKGPVLTQPTKLSE